MSAGFYLLMAQEQRRQNEQKELQISEGMKKFLVYVKQHGEGCDYTIGCGRKVFFIEARDMIQAKDRFTRMLSPEFGQDNQPEWTKDYGGYNGEMKLVSAQIFEVADEVKVDVAECYENIEKFKIEKALKAVEEKERKEFERLKAKYGY